MRKIHVTYCSRYNGCYLTDNEHQAEVEGPIGEKVVDAICDHAVEECDQDGEFYGDIDDIEEFAIKAVKDVFGQDVLVTFEEDQFSS